MQPPISELSTVKAVRAHQEDRLIARMPSSSQMPPDVAAALRAFRVRMGVVFLSIGERLSTPEDSALDMAEEAV